MAAIIKAANAKIRSNPWSDYLCSTHFWGPASNFGIPLAAVMDMRKDPELISGTMTGALVVYAATFMRYSLAVTPKNYLLFTCHLVNFGAQLTQGVRYVKFFHLGGREERLREQALSGGSPSAALKLAASKVEGAASAAATKVEGVAAAAASKTQS